jgi:hypothetical protein
VPHPGHGHGCHNFSNACSTVVRGGNRFSQSHRTLLDRAIKFFFRAAHALVVATPRALDLSCSISSSIAISLARTMGVSGRPVLGEGHLEAIPKLADLRQRVGQRIQDGQWLK